MLNSAVDSGMTTQGSDIDRPAVGSDGDQAGQLQGLKALDRRITRAALAWLNGGGDDAGSREQLIL